MAFGDVVRTGSGTGTSGNASASFDSGSATAGNLLLFAVARSTAHSLGGAWGAPAGFTPIHDSGIQNGNMGAAWWHKIAAGGETGASVAGTNEAGNWTASILELEGPFDPPPLDKSAENEAGLSSTTASISSGATATTSQAEQVSLAFFAIDSGASVSGSRTYSNDFTEAQWAASGGRAAHAIARRLLSSVGAYSCTFGWSGLNDEAYGSIATFKAEPPDDDPPTIAPNTADGAAFSTSTPTLEFTATDPEVDRVRYQVQISTRSDFGAGGTNIGDALEVSGGGMTIHPNPVGETTWELANQVDDRTAQSFEAVGGDLEYADVYFGSYESDGTITNGVARILIYEHQGVYGTSSAPLNAADPADTPTPAWIAESDPYPYNPGQTEVADWKQFTFSGGNRIRLESGQHYLISLDWQPVNTTFENTITIKGDANNNGVLHAGNLYIDGASTANNGPYEDWDLYFRIYETSVTLDKISGADAGFVNTVDGGDSDPFTSGQKVSYTVQAGDALGNGTYYWRARAIDPDGSGVFSSWTATRSFSVSDEGGPLTQSASGALGLSGVATRVVAISTVGALQPAGALGRSITRGIAGAVAFVGVAGRQIGIAVAGSLPLVGTAARAISKYLAGAASFVGGLDTGHAIERLLSGTVGFAGDAGRTVTRSARGALQPAGALGRNIARAVSGAVSFAGALGASQALQKFISGAVGFTGAAGRSVTKHVSGVLQPAGSLARSIAVTARGVFVAAGAVVRGAALIAAGIVAFESALAAGSVINTIRRVLRAIGTFGRRRVARGEFGGKAAVTGEIQNDD